MGKFTDLPIQAGADLTSSWVFAVATATETEQLSWEELQKSFTGLSAQSDAISLIGNGTDYGITVSGNGFLGVNKTAPNKVLDIGDQGGATHPEARITTSATNRSASYTLADSNIYWKNIKKASDTDYYVQVSEDDSNYTGVINIDKDGNVGIFDGSFDIQDKFYVYNGGVTFGSGAYALSFDPSSNLEIKSNTDALRLNYSNNYNIVLGADVVFLDNGATPKVGINNIAPTYLLDVNGTGIVSRLKSLTSKVTMGMTNTSQTSYITLDTDGFNIGPTASNHSGNLFYSNTTKHLGLGTLSPENKLHVYQATGTRLAKFEGNNYSLAENFQTNNYYSGPVGPYHTIYTFARKTDSTGPDDPRWGIGLYKNASTYDDRFVFRVDSDTSSNAAIKASITRNGDLDIYGSYTTTGSYCKGKFTQTYQTRLTGDCIYFNPLYPDSNTNPSGSNDQKFPFGIANYAGSVEKISIFSSDQDLATQSAAGARLEFSFITPSNDVDADGYVSGFYITPPSAPTDLSSPVSGIVGQVSLSNMTTSNTVYSYNKNNFSGSSNFSAGQLLQYRITKPAGTGGSSGYSANVDYTVVSTISYTIT